MRFDWTTLALQIVNFAILVWLLHRFLYQPVLRGIDARKAAIQKQFDQARAIEDQARARLAETDAERAGIAAEREAMLKAAAEQAGEAAAARRAQAEREANALLEAGRKSLAEERERALAELRRGALDLGAEFARRLLSDIPEPLRAEAWIGRIDQHLQSLPPAELEGLGRQCLDGTAVAVVTAMPLPPATAQAWRTRLQRTLGQGIALTFAADPALVAGAELHFPTAVLRLSWRSAMADLRAEIGSRDDPH